MGLPSCTKALSLWYLMLGELLFLTGKGKEIGRGDITLFPEGRDFFNLANHVPCYEKYKVKC